MIENILGWSLLIAVPAIIIFGIVKARRAYEQYTLKRDQEETARAEKKAKAARDWQKAYTGATHVGRTSYDYTTDRTRTTVKERETGREMSYVHTNDSGPDLLTTMLVADMLFKNKDSSAGTVSWKGDVPSVTESSKSSWGFDDDDTRKSASSSFSSSDSSSSWSDSSSSSDSGPSSDW
jgi:hypothetical protein